VRRAKKNNEVLEGRRKKLENNSTACQRGAATKEKGGDLQRGGPSKMSSLLTRSVKSKKKGKTRIEPRRKSFFLNSGNSQKRP